MSGMVDELRGLVSSRSADLDRVCGVKGVNDRIDALTLLCRDVLRSSTLCYIDGSMHFFGGRYYLPCDPRVVLAVLGNVLVDAGVSPTDVRRMADMPVSVVLERSFPSDRSLIAFSNGVYSLSTREFVPSFDPASVVTESLPYPYDKDAPVPEKWNAFLCEVLPDPAERKVLQEFFGMVYLDREAFSVEKFALFVGKGANGKSVIFEVIKRVLGPDNVSTLDSSQLTKENMVPYVKGKRLNFSPDIRKSSEFDSALKALASGQDITGRRIYGDAEKVKCPPLAFALNEMPRFRDTTPAFFRRLLLFSFDVQIPPERQDKALAAKICADELPGIFNWIMEGLRRLISRGGEFASCAKMERNIEALQKVVSDADIPVKKWLDAHGLSVEPCYEGQPFVLVSQNEIALALGSSVSRIAITREMQRWGVRSIRSKELKYKVYPKPHSK